MAGMTCPTCGMELHNDGESCVYCGYTPQPRPSNKARALRIAGLAFQLCAVLVSFVPIIFGVQFWKYTNAFGYSQAAHMEACGIFPRFLYAPMFPTALLPALYLGTALAGAVFLVRGLVKQTKTVVYECSFACASVGLQIAAGVHMLLVRFESADGMGYSTGELLWGAGVWLLLQAAVLIAAFALRAACGKEDLSTT